MMPLLNGVLGPGTCSISVCRVDARPKPLSISATARLCSRRRIHILTDRTMTAISSKAPPPAPIPTIPAFVSPPDTASDMLTTRILSSRDKPTLLRVAQLERGAIRRHVDDTRAYSLLPSLAPSWILFRVVKYLKFQHRFTGLGSGVHT